MNRLESSVNPEKTGEEICISLIEKIVKLIKLKNFDLVIASRFQKGSNITGLSFFRTILSESARLVFKLFFYIKNVEDFYKNRSLLKVSILPEDIAEGVYFFASSKSKKSTGNILNVDGGNITSFTR